MESECKGKEYQRIRIRENERVESKRKFENERVEKSAGGEWKKLRWASNNSSATPAYVRTHLLAVVTACISLEQFYIKSVFFCEVVKFCLTRYSAVHKY